ncbi:MAG TPA: matrixin family metalloprotease [Myxococcota bacterium]
MHPANEVARKWSAPSFALEMQNSVPAVSRAAAFAALQSAARTWNHVGAATVIEPVLAGDDLDANPVARDGRNRVGVYPGLWPWPASVGAVTAVWTDSSGSTIEEADLALNPSFDFAADRDGKTGTYDITDVLTHELGHALGLPDIQETREATMFYLILPGETLKRDLSHEDEAMLFKLYQGIDDPTPGCSAAGQDTPGVVGACAVTLLAMRRRTQRARR